MNYQQLNLFGVETETPKAMSNMVDYSTEPIKFGQIFSDSLSVDKLIEDIQFGVGQAMSTPQHFKPSKVSREFREGVCARFIQRHETNSDWHCGYAPKGKELGVCLNYKHNYVLTFVTGGDMSGIFIKTDPARVFSQPIGALRNAFLETKDPRVFFPERKREFDAPPTLYFVVLRYLQEHNSVVWEIAQPAQASYDGGRVDHWDLRFIMPSLSLDATQESQLYTPIDVVEDIDLLTDKDVRKKA